MSVAKPFVSKAPKMGFVSAFDGIRGIGIMMVLYEHMMGDSTLGMFSLSPIIDVFLVLSAFLIVTLLLQEHRSTDTIDLRKFYQRRAIRLFPTLWLFLVTMIVLSLVFFRDMFGEVLKDAGAAFFYVYNLAYPPTTAAFDPVVAHNRTMSPLWTLALEEQFYMIIAGTVLLCIVKRWIKPLILVSLLGAIVVQYFRAKHVFGPFQITMQRPDALLLGVALAGVNAHIGEMSDKAKRALRWGASVALTIAILTMLTSAHLVKALGGPYVEGIPTHYDSFVDKAGERVVSTITYDPDAVYFFEYGHTVVVWCTLLVVWAFYRTPEWRAARFMSLRPFRYVGRLSYTLYVWHILAVLIAVAVMGEPANAPEALLRGMLGWAVAFGLAIPVYKYVELRFQQKKLKFSAEKVVVDVSSGKEIDLGDPELKSAEPAVPGQGGTKAPDGASTDGSNGSSPGSRDVADQNA